MIMRYAIAFAAATSYIARARTVSACDEFDVRTQRGSGSPRFERNESTARLTRTGFGVYGCVRTRTALDSERTLLTKRQLSVAAARCDQVLATPEMRLTLLNIDSAGCMCVGL